MKKMCLIYLEKVSILKINMTYLNQFNLENNDDFSSEYDYFNEAKYTSEPIAKQEVEEQYQDFFLYCDINSNNDSLFIAEDNSTKDKPCLSVASEPKTDTNESVKQYMMVPFLGEAPDMDQFERLIQQDMGQRGASQMVNDALEISNDEDSHNDSSHQLIKVKKRKTKGQLKQLEDEFAKNNDWSKEFMNEFAELIKLDPAQVYKWHWDQICKKLGKNPKKKEKAIKKKLSQECKRRKRATSSKSAKIQKTSE
jgi:hypothetical protein